MIRSNAFIIAALFASLPLGAYAADIAVGDPYARAVPPGQPNSAVFMSLSNESPDNRALVGAESSVAEVVELHTHVEEGGMMRMRRVDRIDVPAGQTVELKPGGLHVMLIGLKKTLEPGAKVDVTLIYDDDGKETFVAPVRAINMKQMH